MASVGAGVREIRIRDATGAFRVIYDPILCRIRALRPWLEWDRENEADSKPSPPLIPPRFYTPNDVAWENKRDLVPKSVFIRATRWRLLFYSGLAAPPNGIYAHAAGFDEEVVHPSWYTEVAARMRMAVTRAREQARGHEALLVSHQLPIWTARLDLENRRFAHDPRNRQCDLASLTSLMYDDDDLTAIVYTQPCADLVARSSKGTGA